MTPSPSLRFFFFPENRQTKSRVEEMALLCLPCMALGPPLARLKPLEISAGNRCQWTKVDDAMVGMIAKKYFDADSKSLSCDLFLIDGVPAACIFYSLKSKKPVVREIHMNKAMLLMYDAGMTMRSMLRERYRRVDLSCATNRNEFLLV